ncbi:MAG: endolytic transglycosylase MltG [Granulosicoccaceae bacterium]
MRFISILLLVFVAAAGWLVYDGDRSLQLPLTLNGEATLHVPAGSNLKTLAEKLQRDGVIERAEYLYGYARLKQQAHKIKAGEFALNEQMSGYDLLRLLVQGKSVQYRVTLVEGWNMRQVREALAGADKLQDDLSALDDTQLLAALKLQDEYTLPEGLFMPDTYQYTAGDKATAILRRAQAAMADYLDKAWPQRDQKSPLKTPYEAVILASIVEKETGVGSERGTISGVFSRRLIKGMKLQTDPTVIYGIGPDFDGDIRRKDLRTDTPYNTYTRYGLPPTPIALAGREAIDAALHPEAGSSFYFVAKGDGSHQFSDNLQQHEAAVRKYQLKR